MNKTPISILCKVAKIEYLKQLQKGLVYMNRLDFYTKSENQKNGCGFLDREEGMLYKGVDLTIDDNKGRSIEIKNTDVHTGMSYPAFCCTDLIIPEISGNDCKTFVFDQRIIQAFSDGDGSKSGALFIKKFAFIQKVIAAIEKEDLDYCEGNIRYEIFENSNENTNNSPKLLFRKDPKYSYQNEYRIVLRKPVDKAYILNIGDISDISILVSTDLLRNPIKVSRRLFPKFRSESRSL